MRARFCGSPQLLASKRQDRAQPCRIRARAGRCELRASSQPPAPTARRKKCCAVRSEAASRPVPGARPHAVLLGHIRNNLHADLAESFVRIRGWIIRDRITVSQVLANRFERLYLLLPSLCKVSFATGPVRDAAEDRARNRILVHV